MAPPPEVRATLLRPPPEDETKSPIENVLEVTELAVLGPDIFTNTREPWHPPGARGIYGGVVIAQCLAAGQQTVPADFTPHSLHCYFLLAGAGDQPILFHVERVRTGRSFATRTVQARQKGKCIFTTTISFVKTQTDKNVVAHAAAMPAGLKPPADEYVEEEEAGLVANGPFQSYRIDITNRGSADPCLKRTRQWVRARGRVSERGGQQAHLNALAYMSDSYFIGTISRIHKLWRYPFKPEEFEQLAPELKEHIRRLNDFEGGEKISEAKGQRQIGMMVSLDHTIYFHEPGRVRADEWMLSEMESPWSGDGRGLVRQHIWAKDGTLLATCVQEGLVRLKEPEQSDGDAKSKSKL